MDDLDGFLEKVFFLGGASIEVEYGDFLSMVDLDVVGSASKI